MTAKTVVSVVMRARYCDIMYPSYQMLMKEINDTFVELLRSRSAESRSDSRKDSIF